MDRGSRVTAPRLRSENTADWSPICAELKNLTSDLVNVDGQRLRIEAVVGTLDSRDVLRRLWVDALTPSHQDIARYILDSSPSATVAAELATLVSEAERAKTRAEEVIKPLQERLKESGAYHFKTHEVGRDLLHETPMKRRIPDFQGFAEDPLSMDSAFSLDRSIKREHLTAEATLHPDHRYTLLKVTSDPGDEVKRSAPLYLKVRAPRDFWKVAHSREEVIAALHSATFEAMHTLISEGSARSALLLSDPSIDARLKRGIVDPVQCSFRETLAEGGRIMIEEGDTVACVRLESSEDERATAFTWRILSSGGILLPNDSRLIEAHDAARLMVDGSASEKTVAIRKLNNLIKGVWTPPSDDPAAALPYQLSPLADITSGALAKSLSSLPRCKVRVVKPSADLLILDLIDGYRSIALDFRDPGHSRRNPHDPDTIFFGFRNDGALKVVITSPLNNHLEAVVPASYFTEHRGIEGTVMRLASLFNRQTQEGFLEVRREMEWLAAFNGEEVSLSCSVFRDPQLRFPSTYDSTTNKAFQTAAELALVYEADVPLSSLSEVKLLTDDPFLCEMVIGKNSANAPATMHLLVSEVGVHGVDLHSAAGRHYTFTLETPLSLPEGREVLTTLFRLLRSLPTHRTQPEWNVDDPLTDTQLFSYLHDCERRFAAN